MNNIDIITAATMFGAWCLSAINVWALIKDNDAKGIRPYASLYLSVSNTVLSVNLWSVGSVASASVSFLYAALNIVNASLIIWHQWLPQRYKDALKPH